MRLSDAADPPGAVREAMPWEVSDARWRDVSGMVNIVVAAAAQGSFAPAFLDVRYQIGLALQLFSAVLRGRVAVRGQPATPVTVRVVRLGREVQGFALVREFPHAAAAPHLELHLLVVGAEARRKGVGEALLRDCVSRLADGQGLWLSTLTQAGAMKRLVRKLGAHPLGVMHALGRKQQPLEAFVFGSSEPVGWQRLPWRDWLGSAHWR